MRKRSVSQDLRRRVDSEERTQGETLALTHRERGLCYSAFYTIQSPQQLPVVFQNKPRAYHFKDLSKSTPVYLFRPDPRARWQALNPPKRLGGAEGRTGEGPDPEHQLVGAAARMGTQPDSGVWGLPGHIPAGLLSLCRWWPSLLSTF